MNACWLLFLSSARKLTQICQVTNGSGRWYCQPASGFFLKKSHPEHWSQASLLRDVRIGNWTFVGSVLTKYHKYLDMKSVGSSKLPFLKWREPLVEDYPVKLWGDRKLLKKEFNVLFSGCDSIGVWMVTSCSPEELRRWPPISCFHFETPSVHGCNEKTQELLAAFFHADFLLLKKYDHDISWVIRAWSLRLNCNMRQKYALRKWMASITWGFKSYRARPSSDWCQHSR